VRLQKFLGVPAKAPTVKNPQPDAYTVGPTGGDKVGSAQAMYRASQHGTQPGGEDLMAAKRKWSDLSDRSRKLIITVAVAEGILKVAALIDIKHRPASQIRGPKWLWAPVVAVVNSAGVVPISYFVFGRRQPPSQPD
jgi:hypothetical protein